ncbi:DNA replication regulator SLD3-domain-containing protein [Truncatella angustata]|uniref:DNA replication regulator SLD3-domain-containing protein n=1 Tax=Truncatella angustata TaxID=152316 RepID=A0A9P8UEH2_9PEZI|nr:DNA replication regulator SLD3-domain-containing protein [Truncatella angustata]KAH6648451.1 DNA replication regulator SLD3-domain-containing protein [Truncatella angustata]
MSSKASSSDASRQFSRVNALAPSSDNCLNYEHVSTPTSSGTARKHDTYAMDDLLKTSIVVKPYPSKLSIKPRSLQPLMLLPREHLPLSHLDLATPSGDFEHARQYESTIKILDLESRMGNRPVVLIARMETNKTPYAIERQNGGLYTLCRLGNWVDLIQLSSHATVAYTRLLKARATLIGHAQPEASTTPQLHSENKKRRLAMEAIQSLVKRPARSQSISLQSQDAEGSQASMGLGEETAYQTTKPAEPLADAGSIQTEERTATLVNTLAPEQSAPSRIADDIFENVRTHYLEALYHSMGSLAYFAKGPLSRARAAFHLDCESNLNTNELIDFLKGLILTTVQIDKKYRESVPDIIAKMKTHVADSADEQATKVKKRKTKKLKLGKDGLYPTENEHVRKWWDVRKPQPRDNDSVTTENPQETRLQISRLRSRETQLQMILILEILALEPVKSPAGAEDSQLPDLPKDESVPDAAKETAVKKRNKHNFPVLLDVHADRLSIWQSTSLDEIKILDDSQSGISDAAQKPHGSHSDPLKDFCVEIIVPFFSSRLPEQCDALNRKLGGPVMPSPQKSKPKAAEPMAKPKARPGALTKRPSTSKPTRTLERVLSKETERHRRSISRGPGSMIALMRSATTPVPMLKREISDTSSLASLPNKDAKDASAIQDVFSSSFGASRRTSQETKAQREADIQAELQEAISSLRKPNREVVVSKAMAEADQRKVTTSLSQLKKSRKPTEHLGTHSIIKATPAGPRFRNALAKEANSQPTMDNMHESIEQGNVSSSSRAVPSSAPRKRKADAAFMIAESSPALPTMSRPTELIDATPARPFLKRSFVSAPEPDDGFVLASSPVATRRFLAVPNSTLKYRDSGIGMPSSPHGGVAETPLKKQSLNRPGSLEGFVTVTPVKKRTVNNVVATPAQPKLVQEKESAARRLSIYERLGWDDDYDDLN